MVFEAECKRLLQNLWHVARVQAVRDYYASQGITMAKKKCRSKFLSREKYLSVITPILKALNLVFLIRFVGVALKFLLTNLGAPEMVCG